MSRTSLNKSEVSATLSKFHPNEWRRIPYVSGLQLDTTWVNAATNPIAASWSSLLFCRRCQLRCEFDSAALPSGGLPRFRMGTVMVSGAWDLSVATDIAA